MKKCFVAVIMTVCISMELNIISAQGETIPDQPYCQDAFESKTITTCNARVEELEAEIGLIDKELCELETSLDWLGLKIHRMIELGKKVPNHLDQSMTFKKNRILALKKNRAEYSARLKKVRESLPNAHTDQYQSPQLSNAQCKDLTDLISTLEALGISEWFEVVTQACPNSLKTAVPILFSSGSAIVPKSYQAFFIKLSMLIKKYNTHVVVEGYADTDPIHTQRFPSNFELGAIRATNVAHALIRYGVDPSLFKIVTTGQYRFPTDRYISDNKHIERYVRITLIPKDIGHAQKFVQ